MPTNWLHIDGNFPDLDSEGDLRQQVREMGDYLYMLVEQLRYTMQNLDGSNMNGKAVSDFRVSVQSPIYVRLEGEGERISKLEVTLDGVTITDEEGSTRIKGSTVETGSLDLTGRITFSDLDEDTQDEIAAAQDAAGYAAGLAVRLANGTYSGGTFISGTTVATPEIIGGTVTGAYLRSVLDAAGGVGGEIEMYHVSTTSANLAGGIRLDTQGAGTENERSHRMFLYTNTVGDIAFALKLQAAGGMSLESKDNIYMKAATSLRAMGNIVNLTAADMLYLIGGTIKFYGNVDFSDATVTGLEGGTE